jgi:hypothetical protein
MRMFGYGLLFQVKNRLGCLHINGWRRELYNFTAILSATLVLPTVQVYLYKQTQLLEGFRRLYLET